MNSGLAINQRGFILANALRLGTLSQQAYSDPAQINEQIKPGSPLSLIAGVAEDVQVVITRFDDCITLAFRGSVSLRNWIEDADFPLRHTPDGRVHSGFLAGIDCVLGLIASNLQPPGTRKDEVLPIIITGHSLGGALAVLCGFLLTQQGFPVRLIYTFGQPRVGDATFAAAYQTALGDRTFCVVNQNDIVPRLPGWLAGFRRVGNLEFINVRGVLVENPSLIGLLISDLLGLYAAYRKLDDVLINEHFMAAYLASLNSPKISPL